MRVSKNKGAGFTLLEVVVGIALIAIAILGLAQMFTLSVLNNMRSDRITNASFLAQQQIDILRNLTNEELTSLSGSSGLDVNGDGTMDILQDEQLDVNNDTVYDYRRLTEVQASGTTANVWEIGIYVFSAEELTTARSTLLLSPEAHRVKAKIHTVISRFQ